MILIVIDPKILYDQRFNIIILCLKVCAQVFSVLNLIIDCTSVSCAQQTLSADCCQSKFYWYVQFGTSSTNITDVLQIRVHMR